MSVANNIKSTLPKTKSAKEFMNFVEERSQTADKSLDGTLMGTLTTIKFDGSETTLKNQGTRFIHLINDQEARKKNRRKHGKGKQ
ncbi:hypothetical protein ACOSQ2_019670 [Xanthoceras sorbifolium]